MNYGKNSTKTLRSLVEAANSINEARASTGAPKTLKDIKVGDIFYHMRGQGDSMPEFFRVKTLGDVEGYARKADGSNDPEVIHRKPAKRRQHGWDGVLTMTVNLVPLHVKFKPTASRMAGTAVPDLETVEVVGRTTIATAEEHPLDTKGALVLLKIVRGNGAPLAQKWDGKPVPYTAWG